MIVAFIFGPIDARATIAYLMCMATLDTDTIATRLQARRGKAGHTRVALAELSGVSRQMVGALELGERLAPSWQILGRLERALGLRHGDLTRGLDPAA